MQLALHSLQKSANHMGTGGIVLPIFRKKTVWNINKKEQLNNGNQRIWVIDLAVTFHSAECRCKMALGREQPKHKVQWLGVLPCISPLWSSTWDCSLIMMVLLWLLWSDMQILRKPEPDHMIYWEITANGSGFVNVISGCSNFSNT